MQLAVQSAAGDAVSAQSVRLAEAAARAAAGVAGAGADAGAGRRAELAQMAVAACDAFVLVLTPAVLGSAPALAAADAALEHASMPIVVVCDADARPAPLCTRCKSWPAAEATEGPEVGPPSRCEAHSRCGFYRVGAEAVSEADRVRGLPIFTAKGAVDLHAAFARASAPPPLADVPAAAAALAPMAAAAAPAAEHSLAARLLACGRATVVPWSADRDFEQASVSLLLHAASGVALPAPTPLFSGLACRRPAPPLASGGAAAEADGRAADSPTSGGRAHHVCILHDASTPAAIEACGRIEEALAEEFKTARVLLLDVGATAAAPDGGVAACAGASCVLLFLTAGLLRAPLARTALRAILHAGVRVVVAHEPCAARGGSPAFEDFMRDAVAAPEAASSAPADGTAAAAALAPSPALRAILDPARSVPWRQHTAFAPIVALKLINAGLMDPAAPEEPAAPCAEHAVSLEFFLTKFVPELAKARVAAGAKTLAAGAETPPWTTVDVVKNFVKPQTDSRKCRRAPVSGPSPAAASAFLHPSGAH